MVKQALLQRFPMQQRPWLNRLEYLSIAASVAGVITTTLTQQILWTATPLLLMLGVNTAQRRQLQTCCTQLTQQVETLETTLPDLALGALDGHDLDQFAAQIATLEQAQGQTVDLKTHLEEMRSQLAALAPLGTTTQNLQTQWQALESQNLPQAFAQLQTSVLSLQELLQFIPQTQSPASPESSPSDWQAPLAALEARLNQWQQAMESQQQMIQVLTSSLETRAPDNHVLEKDVTENLETALPSTVHAGATVHVGDSGPSTAVTATEDAPEESVSNSSEAPLPQPLEPTAAENVAAPPAVPLQYRREHFGPNPAVRDSHPVANTASVDQSARRSARSVNSTNSSTTDARRPAAPDLDGPNTTEAKTTEAKTTEAKTTEAKTVNPHTTESNAADATAAEPNRLDFDEVLSPELEAGVKELGESLWAMGQSLRQSWDRLAQGFEAETAAAQGWELAQTYGLPQFMPQAIAFQGQYVAYGTAQGTVHVVDWQRQALEAQLAPDSAGITAIAFSPDAQSLLVGQTNGQGSLWYWSSGELRHTLSGHPLPVTTVAVSPHGRTCATGSADKTIALWDVGTGQLLRSLTGHWDRLTSVVFSHDGKSLITGSQDGTVKRWDIQTGHKVANATPGVPVTALAVGAAGQGVVGGGDRSLYGWVSNSLAQKSQHRLLRKLTAVATDPHQEVWGAIAGANLHIWDAATDAKLATLNTGQPAIALQWLPQREGLLCVTEGGELQRWQPRPQPAASP